MGVETDKHRWRWIATFVFFNAHGSIVAHYKNRNTANTLDSSEHTYT